MTDVAHTDRFLLSVRDNPHAPARANGRKFWGHPERRDGLQAIRTVGIHTTEGGTPINTARWQAHQADRASSYHVIAGADGLLRTLEDEAVAFHIAGHNTPSLGLAFAGRAADWGNDPDRDLAALAHGARQAAAWRDAYDIPLRWLTKTQADRGEPGFVRHSTMDPSRRSDPGRGFPADIFFELIDQGSTTEDIMASIADLEKVIRSNRDQLLRERLNETVRLAQAGAAGAVAQIRAEVGLPPDAASDMIHVQRIRDGKHGGRDYTIETVRERLEQAARDRT